MCALALNATSPSTRLELDGKTVAEHAAAWEAHWASYFQHRAVEGIGVELGSPTYGKYRCVSISFVMRAYKMYENVSRAWFLNYG